MQEKSERPKKNERWSRATRSGNRCPKNERQKMLKTTAREDSIMLKFSTKRDRAPGAASPDTHSHPSCILLYVGQVNGQMLARGQCSNHLSHGQEIARELVDGPADDVTCAYINSSRESRIQHAGAGVTGCPGPDWKVERREPRETDEFDLSRLQMIKLIRVIGPE